LLVARFFLVVFFVVTSLRLLVRVSLRIGLEGSLALDRRSQVRWLADHFLSRKLDTLSTFWVAVAEWHDVIVEKHSALVHAQTTSVTIAPLHEARVGSELYPGMGGWLARREPQGTRLRDVECTVNA
jgi:hypothetical protein